MSAQFVIGNTYRKIPLSEARLDRSGNYRKTHDWTLFVDVVSGDPDIIERVAFDLGSSFPQTFLCASPIPVTRPNGTLAWRFSTRQQTYGPVTAKITIRGTGGTVVSIEHRILLDHSMTHKKPPVQTFNENRPMRGFRMLKLPETQRFGIELELTSAVHIPPEAVAANLSGSVDVIYHYGQGRSTLPHWKIVPDGSILCSSSMPDCNKFELVSPVLEGGSGLSSVANVLRALGDVEPKLKVNKSMGFHVHIDVSTLSHQQLIKVCQNFIKYEDVMDSLMPVSRRNGSPECERYFQSNRRSIGDRLTNKQRHDALAACADTAELVGMMNRDGRYYKLNMQNLVTGRQPTIEFRQHSATVSHDKVSAWVRFCVTLVHNSARLKQPSPFLKGRSLEYQYDCLFQYVIKDRALRDFYRERRNHLEDDENAACCTGCASGGTCSAKKVRRN